MHEESCFVTLTYNDAHLPFDEGLDYREFQLFMKRLRKKFRGRRIRFFMCGEYGESGTRRPHYHACLFGIDFRDRVYFKTGKSGCKVFTSKTLDGLWTDRMGNSIGFCTVGNLDFASAGYTARYVMKKGLGRGSERDYRRIDVETGEVYEIEKEFCHMSLKDGIGLEFYKKYLSDIFPRDFCVVDGKKMKPPKYYYKKLAEMDGDMYNDVHERREIDGIGRRLDNTPERRAVKEKVLAATIKFLKREI